MPTPFMHMAVAHRLREDSAVSSRYDLLWQDSTWSAFLLGTVAPDARVSSGLNRADTHFFEYQPVITPPPIQAMMHAHPELRRANLHGEPGEAEHAAFIAGYLTHLAMDEVWSNEILFPCFIDGWGDSKTRFKMLHMLLGYLDALARQELHDDDYVALGAANPDRWLPFMGDQDLTAWRDIIATQIAPGAESQSLHILSQRIQMPVDQMSAFIADDDRMQDELWANVPPGRVQAVEVSMYRAAYQALTDYLTE